jgi:adenylate cyclase
MAEERAQRRFAAIVAADVVGYSHLMQRDEAGTLAALKTRRTEVLQPLVVRHRGRIVKLMGDGVLIEFPSAVDAVECAVRLQKAMDTANARLPEDRRILLRIGINLGDVMVEGSDLYGDGVNIAARIERLAEPGGILVSQTVFNHVRGKVQVGFEDFGEHSLKNMPEPVRVYKVSGADGVAAPDRRGQPTKVSIAVLPFANMSGDAEQEYFSDGITEDVITDLSKASALSVIASNTAFTFKGKAVEVTKIARQLNVGYIVEGSVRKAGGRVRITAQLIDGSRGDHVWAERYDRELSDIFALQDEISRAIVATLKLRLLPEEKKAIATRSTHNLDAYQLYLLARHYHAAQPSAKNLEIAGRFCQRALEIDPNYARAWALLGICQAGLYNRGRLEESGLSAAERALSLDLSLAEAHAAKGRALAENGRFEEAFAAHQESLRLEPDSFDVRYNFARTCFLLGRHEEAIEHCERAAELLETDIQSLDLVHMSYEALGRHEEGISAARRSLERVEREIAAHPENTHALVLAVAALARLGEKERAKQWALRAQIIEPDDPMDHYNLACALAQINEPEQALDMLESYENAMTPMTVTWMRQDTDLISLHGHPRFQALIARGETRLAAARTEQREKAV